jgi:hypothetical protein
VQFLAPDFIEAMVTEVGRVIPAGGRHAALTGGSVSRRQWSIQRAAGVSWAARSDQSTGVVPMSNSVDSFVLWPVGIAFGGWLFFEIARRM